MGTRKHREAEGVKEGCSKIKANECAIKLKMLTSQWHPLNAHHMLLSLPHLPSDPAPIGRMLSTVSREVEGLSRVTQPSQCPEHTAQIF